MNKYSDISGISSPVLPNNSVIVGLDISVTSTGLVIISNQGIWLDNFSVSREKGYLEDAKRRIAFRGYLENTLKDFNIYRVIVEDVFLGQNAVTYRELINLNTVIDELLVTNRLNICDDASKIIVRVQNGVWKKWIRSKIEEGQGIIHDSGRYLSAKGLVRESLSAWGIDPDSLGGGKGNQDRCDAFGMAFGWVVNQEKTLSGEKKAKKTQSKELTLSDVEFWYSSNLSEDLSFESYSRGRQETLISKGELNRIITKGSKSFQDWVFNLVDNKDRIYIVKGASLGALGRELGFPVIWGGADFAFCIK